MPGYEPHYIAGYESGLIKERVSFTLPEDAFTRLNNAYVWRERVVKKRGSKYLDRLKRRFDEESLGDSVSGTWEFNLFDDLSIDDTNRELQTGSVTITIDAADFVDNGRGVLENDDNNHGTIDYVTGDIAIEHTQGVSASTATFNYFPGRSVMGISLRERDFINFEDTIIFDTKYAYSWNSSHGFTEFIAGTEWNGDDHHFFSTANWWRDGSNRKVFWATNYQLSPTGDRTPIRWTNGEDWFDFTPPITDNGTTERVYSARVMIPYRERFVLFNTIEGTSLSGAEQFPQRVRWSELGTPFYEAGAGSVNADNFDVEAWRSDIEGKGDFVDIPTTENIIGVGWVRDIVIIFCERSTFQMRYTNVAAVPFIIERVNTELGIESTFSMVQFDTSVVGIGDKGIVECDGYKSEKIDTKIPDFAFEIKNIANGRERVHGIRDFRNRLAFWIYPEESGSHPNLKFPNKRLVYNYENGAWATFDDNWTALGRFYRRNSLTWRQATFSWRSAKFPWFNRGEQEDQIIGGNSQGFLGTLDRLSANEKSLTITAIEGREDLGTLITSPRHNLNIGSVISIQDIPVGTRFATTLNDPPIGVITGATQADPCVITSEGHGLETGSRITIRDVEGMVELNSFTFTVTVIDDDSFSLDDTDSTNFTAYTDGGTWTSLRRNKFAVARAEDANGDLLSFDNQFTLLKYNDGTESFDTLQMNDPTPEGERGYVGGGRIAIRDNFSIRTKKFGYIEQGQATQIGHVDLLVDASSTGEIAMKIFMNYNDSIAINEGGDPFFNVTIPQANQSDILSSRSWQRVYAPTYGAFIELEYTHSDKQMSGEESESSFSISAQVLHMRAAGKNFVTA